MGSFLARFGSLVTAVLSGFDRLVVRGTILALVREGGMFTHLDRSGIRLLDFKDHVSSVSGRLKASIQEEAQELGRPTIYLPSSGTDKEKLARKLLEENPISEGLICVLSAVEPCMSFEYHRSQNREARGLKRVPRKCLHFYKYFIHPQFGFMNARIQTWYPFDIQICLNGREWLVQQLRAEGIAFERYDNCLTRVEDSKRVQELANEQLKINWPQALDAIGFALNPLHLDIFGRWPQDYYWSVYQSELATDLLFQDPATLAELYPRLVKHAMTHFQSPDVMRFLGRKLHPNFSGEVISSFKNRPEGARVKHWANGNSVKMYDKGGSVLRVETTLANPKDFKVLRPVHDHPDQLKWQPLRKGVADLHRRAEVSQRSNERYLEALAAVDDTTPLSRLLDQVASPTTYHDQRVRALRIGDQQDIALLQAVSRGEFATAGFRNRDIRQLLHPDSPNLAAAELRRLSAKIGRQLRLLRAHGLIQKITKTHRYVLTTKGHHLTAGLFAARNSNIKDLLANAA